LGDLKTVGGNFHRPQINDMNQARRDMSEPSVAAEAASIKSHSKLLGVKAGREQELVSTLERLNVSALEDAFKMGFDAGVAYAENLAKDA
jgi:hypothetical protein